MAISWNLDVFIRCFYVEIRYFLGQAPLFTRLDSSPSYFVSHFGAIDARFFHERILCIVFHVRFMLNILLESGFFV